MRRPPGLRLDSGGVAKGLFADLLALELGAHDAFAVDCAGDLRVGGAAGMVRPVRVADPFDGHTLHIFELVDRGVATSGIGRRSWLDGDARPAHHLLDPTTGRPAFTGVVQATAVGLRPLERIGRTAGAIAAGDLSRRVEPATERTEVGRLGLALNAMLGRLERAFAERHASEERLRRFLADASHELRTPLASIRGYAELFRTGAARDPADSERAMRRIEDEAARMGVLVEDLLTLARLEEGRDEIRQEVDVAAIARDAVDDARVTAPERRIEVDGAPAATVLGDPHQLRQVVGNLMRNALVHTPAGTPSRCWSAARAATSSSRCETTVGGCRPAAPSRYSSASGARNLVAAAGAPGPASGSPSSPGSWMPTAAA